MWSEGNLQEKENIKWSDIAMLYIWYNGFAHITTIMHLKILGKSTVASHQPLFP